MDYYERLGVSRNASEKEIKTAFRKLAAKHHPDKGGDHKVFTELNEAYQTLTDPEKKQMYDQFGTTDPQQQGFRQQGFNAGNFEDMFSQMFGQGMGGIDGEEIIFGPGGFQRRSRNRNHNVRTNLQISLDQAYHGHEVTIQIPMPTGGTRTLDVKIPKGIDHGQTIRLRGLGDQSIKGAPPGDLHVTVTIHDQKGYKRVGNDLQKDLTVDVFDLILGTKVKVEHLNGQSYSLNVPSGTQPNTTYSMGGLGMPILNGNGYGNLYIKIQASIPKDLTPEQLDMITKIKGKQ